MADHIVMHCMIDRVSVLCGVGGYVPSSVVTNADLAGRFDTSDEWIRSRTGIRQRHVVRTGESTGDLAVQAGAAALKNAGVDSVDLVVLATTTPDHPCPATAPAVARGLGLDHVAAFDLGAVCTGFVYGLAAVAGFIAAGLAERVLLIGADTFSTILDPADRGAAAVFGDGAGAVVLRRGDAGELGALLAFDLGSDGDFVDLITVRAGGSKHPLTAGQVPDDHWFSMQGKAVYRHAVRRMAASAQDVLRQVGWRAQDVDWFVGHQANQRILHAVGDQVGIAPERVFVNIDQVGNTVAASIPLALTDATGVLRPGDKVLLTAFGGGITWGSAALIWPALPD
ncbi:3-oxoacyl-[acyl-carrier-protein] synthase-3 [Actinocrispum wychmicini]|uniref:Beta-ketoacyl-[acyl-carrier-protein] synthase III n=2 Tax=Actinocrispum wychmicini TaxID=1213861 RepID=A0A4R2JKT0_9PSEU|nr:3-oxoacyl-[acyl-carrier-protein] synthase-3 [Actinocrispum wychmicini]